MPVAPAGTVAVIVTGLPETGGVDGTATIGALAAGFTVCESTAETAPLYRTVTACVPAARVPIVRAADPFDIIRSPRTAVPS